MPGAVFGDESVRRVFAGRETRAAAQRGPYFADRRLDPDCFRPGDAVANLTRRGVKAEYFEFTAAESVDYPPLLLRFRIGQRLPGLPRLVPARIKDACVVEDARGEHDSKKIHHIAQPRRRVRHS